MFSVLQGSAEALIKWVTKT